MSNKQKLWMLLMTMWVPWLVVFSWNAGHWLSTELFGGIFMWRAPIRETWIATGIWVVLLLVSWALGTGYAWLTRTNKSE